MLILGNPIWTIGAGAFIPPTPPPVSPPTTQPSGGFPFEYGRTRTRRELAEARKRYGLDARISRVIEDVAASQAARLEADAQKRYEELTRELTLRRIAFHARYLEVMNEMRQKMIDAEIAARLKQRLNADEDLMILMMIAAAVA